MPGQKEGKSAVANVLFVSSFLIPVVWFFAFGGFWAYDVRVWYLAGQEAFTHGLLSVYSMQGAVPWEFPGGYFNYPPPWLVWVYTAYAAKQALALNLDQWLYLVRLPALLFTLANGLLIHFCILRKKGEWVAALALFAFLSFPGFSNIVFGPVIGYFDPIPVFFTLASLVLFERKQRGWAALALGIGAAFKYYPLLLLPVFLCSIKNKREVVRFSAYSVIPLLLVSIPPLVYDFNAYVKASTFISNWAGSTSLYRLLYGTLGWDLQLWFGRTLPAGADLALLPIVSLVSLALLGGVILFAYFSAYKKKMALLPGVLAVLMGLLGFWRFAEHNHALWAAPFVVADLFIASERRWIAAAWLSAVLLMSLPYIFVLPSWFELVSAMSVPVCCVIYYVVLMKHAWFKSENDR